MRLTSALLLSTVVSAISLGTCPSKCSCYDTRVDCWDKWRNHIPTSFPPNVRSIDLSNNRIKEVNKFPVLSTVTTLSLANNEITFIESNAFDDFDELLNLDLSKNRLKSFDDKLEPLKLKRLDLSYNLIETFHHSVFWNLPHLSELNLANNRLAWIHPDAFDNSTKLEVLNLSHNRLKYFKYNWVQQIVNANLMQLELRGNSFQCDCAMKEDGQWLSDNAKVKALQSVLQAGEGRSSLIDARIDCTNPDGKAANMFDYKSSSSRGNFECKQPKITGISTNCDVVNGKTLLLTCIATGQPQPQIEWESPNLGVYRLQSDEFEGITVYADGSLIIDSVRDVDAGDYICRAHNSAGESRLKTFVQVDPGFRDGDEWRPYPFYDALKGKWLTNNCIGHSSSKTAHWDDKAGRHDDFVKYNMTERLLIGPRPTDSSHFADVSASTKYTPMHSFLSSKTFESIEVDQTEIRSEPDIWALIIVVVFVGALAVLVACCWRSWRNSWLLKQKLKANQSGQSSLDIKANKNVPVLINKDVETHK